MEEYNEESGLVSKIYAWKKLSESHSKEWRKEARTDYDFYAGKQWSDEDRAILEENERPVVTFNRTAPIINSISGFETANRLEVKFIPRTLDDTMGTDMYTQAAKWARDETDADDEQSEAFKDAVICGMGWTSTKMDYESNPDGIPCEERLDPLRMFWDHTAKKQNLVDRRYDIEQRVLSKQTMQELYPDKWEDIVNLEFDIESGEDVEGHDAFNAWKYHEDQGDDKTSNQYEVLKATWFEREPYYRYVDPEDGKVKETPVGKDVKERLEVLGLQYVKQLKKVYYTAVVGAGVVLEDKKRLSCPTFTNQCITAYRDHRSKLWFGVMRPMRDPQMWANKFFAKFMDIVSSNSSGGLMFETGAVKDIRKLEDRWSDPSYSVELNEGGLGHVRERQMQQFPSSIDRLLQIATGATRDVTGVNLEFLGMANREQAGMVETERKRSVLVILSDLFNSLRRFKRNQGRILLHYIHTFMRPGQLIRITGPEGAQYLPFMKDKSALDYDCIVDTAPDSPNMKQEAWQAVRELLPTMMSAGMPIPKSVLKVLPIPPSMAAQWEKEIQEQTQPDPMQQQAAQIEMEKAKADIEETRSKAALNMAKAQSEGQQDPNQMQLEFARLEIEQARIMSENQKAAAEAQVKMREIEQKERDILAKERQAEARLEEARIKAQSEQAVARTNAKAQVVSCKTEKKESGEKEDKPNVIVVPIETSSGKKKISISKKGDTYNGTVEEQ